MAATHQTMPDGGWSARIVERRRFSENTFELRLDRPPGFDFKAGQHIAIQAEGTEREYSLVTPLRKMRWPFSCAGSPAAG